MNRISSAEWAEYGRRLGAMSLEEVEAEVKRLNAARVAALAAVETLKVEAAVEVEAEVYDLADVDDVIAMARENGPPADSAAFRNARIHAANITDYLRQAGPRLAELRRQAARKAIKADLMVREKKIRELIAEIEAHGAAAKQIGGVPLLNGTITQQLDRALKIASDSLGPWGV